MKNVGRLLGFCLICRPDFEKFFAILGFYHIFLLLFSPNDVIEGLMHFTHTTYYSVNKENDSGDILFLFLNCGVIKRPDPALIILPNFGYKHEKIYTMKEFPIV